MPTFSPLHHGHTQVYRSPPHPQPTRDPSPQPMQPPLPHLPPGSPINRPLIITTPIPPIHKAQHNLHEPGRDNTRPENPNHDQVTLPILLTPRRLVVTLPARIQRIRREDTAQITESGDNSRRSGYADLAVSRLEDLRRPRHGYRDCWA